MPLQPYRHVGEVDANLQGIGAVKNIQEAQFGQKRNALMDMQTNEFNANAPARADARLMASLKVGSQLAMPYIQSGDDVGLTNYLKARKVTLDATGSDTTHTGEAIAAMESGDPAQIAQAKQLLTQFATMGEEQQEGSEDANSQFGTSRPVVATTQSGKKLNGIMADIRDPNTGEVKSQFIPDAGDYDFSSDPIARTDNVSRSGITGEDQNEATRQRMLELEAFKTEQLAKRDKDKAQTTRLTNFADNGLSAAESYTTTKRSIDL